MSIKGGAEDLAVKTNQCMDELARLLDNIYQFPNRQRELYFERIQSLKQAVTALKSALKEPNYPTLLRKYQHIFLKINDLKAEILSYEAKHNRRKPLAQIHSNTFTQDKYDSIMETIVAKDEQLKACRAKSQGLEDTLRRMEQKEQTMNEEILEIRKEVEQMMSLNAKICEENEDLRHEVRQLERKNIEFESLYSTHREVVESSKLESVILRSSLGETERVLALRQAELENVTNTLAVLQEKYEFEKKQFSSKEDSYRTREKSYQLQISQLQIELEVRKSSDSKIKELRAQNLRCKEDLHVLEAQVALTNEKYDQKIHVLERLKSELRESEEKQSLYNDEIRKMSDQLREQTLLKQDIKMQKERTQSENNSLLSRVAQLEQVKMKFTTLIKELEKSLLVKQEIIRQLEQKAKAIHENISATTEELRKTKFILQEKEAQLKKCETVNGELNRIIEQTSSEKKKIQVQLDRNKHSEKQFAERVKHLQKEIEELKKRLLRAKIQSIHNLRELIV